MLQPLISTPQMRGLALNQSVNTGVSTKSRAGRRTAFTKLRALNEKRSSENGASPDKIKLNIFETAGTAEDKSNFEPFSSNKGGNAIDSLLSTIDFSEPMSFDGEEKTEYDPLRDGPLRYLGYANEVGEAFAAWLFVGGVPLSYAIAIGYVLFDTVDKYNKTLTDAREKLSARKLPTTVDLDKLVNTIGLERGLDTLIWQLIASVAAPGYTIHTVVAIVTGILHTIEDSPAVMQQLTSISTILGVSQEVFITNFNKSVPTACGLAAIPFIVHPIDGAVHALLNATLRPAMRKFICEGAGGKDAGLAICSSEICKVH